MLKKIISCFLVLSLCPMVYAVGESTASHYGTVFSLLPPMIAIILALLTKEVFSSLFIGIFVGGLLYSNFHLEETIIHVFQTSLIGSISDSYNMGIIVFLIVLGVMVSLMNRAGGSAAFGEWASKNIKTKVGAELATIALGCLIFIDDYFNCLTVGSVMGPVTDKHRISRCKLAYLIDSTAAPICIIAPISSWAAAVAGFVDDGQGLTMFIRAIPYNFYAIFSIVMMIGLVICKISYGPMKDYEAMAEKGNLFSNSSEVFLENNQNKKGKVLDLVLPIFVLIVSCVIGMVYSGGFFQGVDFVTAFSESDASVGLMLGSIFALIFTIIFYLARKVLPFQSLMECLPEGFRAMVPAIMILTFAWTLKTITDSLGLKEFVSNFVSTYGAEVQMFLPAIVFLVACFLAFSSGTSWGTFGILIPITMDIFPLDNPLGIICMSACMAGAVCGDHCSPISDTTIMASAGAQCDLVNHVTTQIPYAISVAIISFFTYILAGLFVTFGISGLVALPIGLLMVFGFLYYWVKKGSSGSQEGKLAG